jgi:hypothetical protein
MNQLKTISPTGIQRNNPLGTGFFTDDLVNMRYHNGAWEPVGNKSTALGPNGEEYPDPGYKTIVVHRMDSDTNWIGHNAVTDPHKVYWYNPETLAVLQAINLNGAEKVLDIRFLKRFLLIITDQNLYRLLFRDNVYDVVKLTGIESNFTVRMEYTGEAALNVMTEEAATADALLGKYYKLLREQSDLNRHTGGIFYRYVITLYDGTQILHSLPAYFQIGSFGLTLIRTGTNVKMKFDKFIQLKATVTFADLLDPNAIENFKDVISSIDLYASRNYQFLDVSDVTITNEKIIEWLPFNLFPGTASVSLNEKLPVSEDFKKSMHDSTNWYKIGSVDFANLKQQDAPFDYQYAGDMVMDLKGYYTNYATHPQILVDNYSHQDLTGDASYIYNGRLHLGNTLQTLSKPWNLAQGIIPATIAIMDHPNVADPATTLHYQADVVPYYDSKIVVKLSTTDGAKYVSILGTLPAYRDVLTGARKATFLPALIGYPDSRATEVSVHIKVGGVFYEILKKPLIKSVFSNFSYVVFDQFMPTVISDWVENPAGRRVDANFNCYPIQFELANLELSVIPDDEVNIKDTNRVQPSEADNPFVFPVSSSQQVGTTQVIAFGTNTEDVSVGQRGQYPLYVFCTDGIWGLSIGINGVYITNVTPLSGEVLLNRNSKLDLSAGIAFITAEGLKIISGNQVQDISRVLEGIPDNGLRTNAHLQCFINHPKLVQLQSIVDGVPFVTYLAGAILGFNKGYERSEIVVANPDYQYYYVYDILSGFWSKVGGSLNTLVPFYPSLYAVNSGLDKIVNLSKEIDGPVQCLILSRATDLDMGDTRKKLRRSFIRCHMNAASGKFAAGYLFRTDNLREWWFDVGNDRNEKEFKDIWITHSSQSARFYAYLFVAELDVAPLSKVNRLSLIELEADPKLSSKLR